MSTYNYRGRVMVYDPDAPPAIMDESNSIWVAVASSRALTNGEIHQAVAARTRVIAGQRDHWDIPVDQWTEHELSILDSILEHPSWLRVVAVEDVT